MKNKLESIRTSWTWNHKGLILALALLVAHIYPLIPTDSVQAEVITYERAPIIDDSIEAKLAQRARELYKENENMDLEKYRLDAIRELNNELLSMMDESPFINYEQMAETYGY